MSNIGGLSVLRHIKGTSNSFSGSYNIKVVIFVFVILQFMESTNFLTLTNININEEMIYAHKEKNIGHLILDCGYEINTSTFAIYVSI